MASEYKLVKKYTSLVEQKRRKGYNQIEISYNEQIEREMKKKPRRPSELHDSVQNLMKFIFDMKLIEKSMVKVGYDVKKLPLGKLSKNTISSAYKVLEQLENVLNKGADEFEIRDLSAQFYKHIPHDFGFKPMKNFVINTIEKLKEK
jgi:poly [ADP-ribose] polymerase 2/3/4